MAEIMKSVLMSELQTENVVTRSKVTIVGVGQVGMACAFSLVTQNIASNITLIDVVPDKLRGEMMDLQHGLTFQKNVKIVGDSDYAVTAGSQLCIVTAGARQQPGESRLSLVQRNVKIFKGIIPKLVNYSPDTTILVVSNPVDILTYVAWKLSGLPTYRIIGSGTNLDSSRLRFLTSQKFDIAPSSCHGWIIGEHGDSSVAVWSSMNIAGVRFRDLDPTVGTGNDQWTELHKKVIESAYEIINLKGYTSWGVAMSVSSICDSILNNSKKVFAVSTLVKGHHGVEEDVFLSLPCIIGSSGVTEIIKQTLEDQECTKFQASARTLFEIQNNLDI